MKEFIRQCALISTLTSLIITNYIYSQIRTIELAVSYDANYEAMLGEDGLNPFNSVEERIEAVVDGINVVYTDFNVQFDLVGLERFGTLDLSGSINAPDRVTQLWIKEEGACYKRDMVLHLTGSDLQYPNVQGETQGLDGKLCKSNNFDYNNGLNQFVVITKFQSLWREIRTAAQELGHGMRLTGELCDNIPGNTNDHYFMCQGFGGANPGPDVNYELSPENENILNNILNSSCVNNIDFVEVTCTDFIAEAFGSKEILQECNSSNIEEYNFYIKNDQDIRTFSGIRLSFYGLLTESAFNLLEINSININGNSFDISDFESDYDPNFKRFFLELPSFTLQPNQEYNVSFEFDFQNADHIFLNNEALAYFDLFVRVSPEVGLAALDRFTRYIIPENRTIELENGADATELKSRLNDLENDSQNPVSQVEVVVNGNFDINEDLHIDEHCNFKMKNDARINVLNGKTFTMMNNSITPCSYMRWDQVYLENGANLNFQNVYMRKGEYGIRTESSMNNNENCKINLNGCTLEDFSERGFSFESPVVGEIANNSLTNVGEYGMYIAGESNFELFKGNTIHDATYGVRIHENPFFNILENLDVSNCTAGLMLVNASAILQNSIFSDNLFSIYMHEANGSQLLHNTIGYNFYGIAMEDNSAITIANNRIGTPLNYGPVGISATSTNHSVIHNNDQIISSVNGIRGFHLSNVDIFDNPDISILGNQDSNSGGVSIVNGTHCDVKDNFIFGSEVAFGIETNNSSQNDIKNNFISIASTSNIFRPSAIQLLGSNSEDIIENETNSSHHGNGVLAQNTSDGLFECNLIQNSYNGLSILNNSESQIIKTNYKIGTNNFDFLVRSRLGVQNNHGNEYQNGSVRAFMSAPDLLQSTFLVDGSESFHLPSDPIPNEDWYIDNGMNDEVCDISNIGPNSNISFFGDPTKLCQYWSELKNLQSVDSKIFMIKLIHILEYYNSNSLPLPNCLKLDPVFINICGLESLLSKIKKVENVENISDTRSQLLTDISSILSLHQDYSINKSPEKFYNLKFKVEESKNTFKIESDSDKQELVDLAEDINAINCSDEITNLVKVIWLKNIQVLQETGLQHYSSVDPEIDNYSVLCSDEFGDPVHLARAISSYKGSTVNYAVNDGCRNTNIASPRKALNEEEFNISVFPNPNSGSAEVRFNQIRSGQLSVVTTDGILVKKMRVFEVPSVRLEINESGIYYIKFHDEKSEQNYVKKLIVL